MTQKQETERKLIRGLDESWEVCRDAINSQSTMDNVKDLGLYSKNKKQQLKGFMKETDKMRSVFQKLILDILS